MLCHTLRYHLLSHSRSLSSAFFSDIYSADTDLILDSSGLQQRYPVCHTCNSGKGEEDKGRTTNSSTSVQSKGRRDENDLRAQLS